MLHVYKTVRGDGLAETDISRSRFLAYVRRVMSEEEAQGYIETIRRQHWDATHNCSAYVVGDNDECQKADDDGEPSGTAGRPILEVIKKSSLKYTVIVVTRYFGGIKLGAGGLVRAYSQCAALGLEKAGLVQRRLHTVLAVTLDYHLLGPVEHQLRRHDYPVSDKAFGEKVTVTVLVPAGHEDAFSALLADWTGGQAYMERLGLEYRDHSL